LSNGSHTLWPVLAWVTILLVNSRQAG
jgi:hypothetical protein